MAGFWDLNNYTDRASVQGAPAGGGGYDVGSYGAPGGGGDTNPAGADADPFAYTNGSLLTPWSGHFQAPPGSSGGFSAPAFSKFQYADIQGTPTNVAGFDEQYKDPGDFSYGDYKGPGDFAGVTDKDMKADKGYQFRQDSAMKVLQASKAAQGVLKTGGTAKALQANASNLASQEYGNVYARKRGEYDSTVDNSRFGYTTNRNNAKDSFDTNVRNGQTGFQLRQGAWKDNASNQQANNNLAWTVNSGVYDRNESKARQGYEDEQQHNAAVASAASANANQAYNRALDEYKMGRDEFWNDQDRQYNILDNEDRKGRDASYRYADAQTGIAGQRGDAQAAGRVGAANASAAGWNAIGDTAMDVGTYAYATRPGATPTRRTTGTSSVYSGVPGGYTHG
jgi:hypothetical protein